MAAFVSSSNSMVDTAIVIATDYRLHVISAVLYFYVN